MDDSAIEFFNECDEIIERIVISLQKYESGDDSKDTIDELYRDFHSLKGGAYLFKFNLLGDIAHLIESTLEPVRDGVEPRTQELIDGIYKSLKAIEVEIQFLKGIKSDEPAPAPTPTQEKEETETPMADLTPNEVVVTKENSVSQTMSLQQNSKEKEAENTSIRVPVSLLDNLMTLMGEMVLVRNQVLQYSNNSDDLEFSNLSKRLNAVTSEIQDGMMKTRMQPIGNILSKFNRVVRDLSQELGKSISLTLSGAETELDKSLLEAIKDPLTHLVRNSCDHGIESPELRRQSGKSEFGAIVIKSFHEGGQVVIEITDDGKGLNTEVLLKKGLEKGLITENQAKQMTEKEIFNLIFAAGFSTAQKVTNVSGRGVGMDVVRTNIEKIGGTVELMSVAGKGTTIRIKIPLTLAIVPALIVNSGGGIFAVPQVKLVELVRVDQNSSSSKIEYLQGAPIYRLRGNLLPLVDLNKVLGLTPEMSSEGSSFINIAVLNAEHCSFGLIVEAVQDTADIVVKPLNRLLKSLQLYSGATILGDGSIALILDVLGLSKLAQIGREEQSHNQNEIVQGFKAKQSNSENQDYILVKLNSPTKHAIVLGYVHRLEEFKRSEIEYSGKQRVIRYRDSLLHIVNVNTQLGYKSDESAVEETVPIIVVEKAGTLFGLEVGEILDTLSSPVDPISSLSKQPGIFGDLNTPNELIVVIDPFELISTAYAVPDEKVVVARKVERSLHILFAEDTVFFKKAISAVLLQNGHQVVHAGDGQEALEIFNQRGQEFDLILSDIEMPRMNGFDFAKAVRSGGVHSQIPMMAISSRAEASHQAKGLESGFNIYMEKFNPDLVLKAVADLTSERKKAA